MSVYVIAEAGVNHNGDINIAKRMVDAAKEAGANCIKFQTFLAGSIVSKKAEKADYQKQLTKADESQYDMLKKLELSFDQFRELYRYCNVKGIEFLSTAFDFESIDFLEKLGISKWKVPSGEITNLPYLIKVAKTKKPVILSTGMSNMQEIKEAIDILKNNGSEDITILHATTEYPAPYNHVNLTAMISIRDKLNIKVGYSDHTLGIEVAVAAVTLGATVIEKHFTLDKNMEGPDHKASLEPFEFRKMIDSIRNIEAAYGNGIKKPTNEEMKTMAVVRKSIIAKKRISKGEIFTEENITVKRPGNGLSPMCWFDVLGLKASRNFEEDDLIEI